MGANKIYIFILDSKVISTITNIIPSTFDVVLQDNIII